MLYVELCWHVEGSQKLWNHLFKLLLLWWSLSNIAIWSQLLPKALRCVIMLCNILSRFIIHWDVGKKILNAISHAPISHCAASCVYTEDWRVEKHCHRGQQGRHLIFDHQLRVLAPNLCKSPTFCSQALKLAPRCSLCSNCHNTSILLCLWKFRQTCSSL